MIALHTMLGILKKADMTKFRSLSKMFIRYIPSPSHYILSGFLQIYQRLNIAHYSVSFRRHFMTHPPANFSWVSKSVAGFAFPREKCELEYIVNDAQITHIITMCHEVPTYISDFKSVKHYHLPVEDLTAASLPVIQKAIEIIKQAEAKNEVEGFPSPCTGDRLWLLCDMFDDNQADFAISVYTEEKMEERYGL
ncbi:Dual specificity protein phosphatase 23 isoform 4 [Schistosoma japonicum]|uniref:Dual specificity protein phosphatase 23 isoform 4 n=1 Tax=Schistosoma japonicum TaxID=6182 RepID=A0A4Z2DP35_SCHJA|nr:Dual specificity protein phosphatase 23 isoform 4 [Schistosoma japonicum]